jgi:hypothetical protein
MANYESELTGFLRSLKQSRPEIERKQSEGRALWWDTNPDPQLWQEWRAASVPQPAYVYYAPEPPDPDAPHPAPVKPGPGS